MTHCNMSERSYHRPTSRSLARKKTCCYHYMGYSFKSIINTSYINSCMLIKKNCCFISWVTVLFSLVLNRVKSGREREREMFYLTTHSTHFIYGYMASDIWLRTILIVRKETRCRHIGYSYRLTARIPLYAPSNRQDNTYHGLCYTSRGALAGTRNSSMGKVGRSIVNGWT